VPVMLSGAGAEMPALTLWQRDDYLADRIGHARLLVRTAPSQGATFGDAARLQAGEPQLYEFVDVAAADLLRELGGGGEQPSLYGARIELQVTEMCLQSLGDSVRGAVAVKLPLPARAWLHLPVSLTTLPCSWVSQAPADSSLVTRLEVLPVTHMLVMTRRTCQSWCRTFTPTTSSHGGTHLAGLTGAASSRTWELAGSRRRCTLTITRTWCGICRKLQL